jgi:hypothetical protein
LRKLLLASVAAVGVCGAVSTDAFAQQGPSTYGTYIGGSDLPTAQPPLPGTVVVRINGLFRFYAYNVWDGDSNNNAAGTATGTVGANGQGTATGSNKLGTFGMAEFGRLFPAMDGVAANGLKYGVFMEIRQDQTSGAGGGVFGSISQQNRARASLYFRREYAYIGSDLLGALRIGQSDPADYTLANGRFTNFNDGGFSGDLAGLVTSPVALTYPLQSSGQWFPTTKATYLSPQLYGFDFGISYEPNSGNTSAQSNCGTGGPDGTNFVNSAGNFVAAAGANSTGAASPGCDRLSSTPINAESARRRNTFDPTLRYRGVFGFVGVAANAAYIFGGHVQDNQTGVPFNNNVSRGAIRYDYDGTRLINFGAVVTIGGLSFGGTYLGGRYNGAMGVLVPKGLPDGHAWVLGSTYTRGPLIMGVAYLVNEGAGDLQNAVQGRIRREWGLTAGGTLAVAPGFSLYLSSLWETRHQNGYDFITGQGVTATALAGNPFNNRTVAAAVSLGTTFSW